MIPNLGGCVATDRITVDGMPVGSMRREAPMQDHDSGWMFFAGDESEEYLDDAGNLAIYDVNTIANYDPAIIPYLYAVPGQVFDRRPGTSEFMEAEDSEPDAGAEVLSPGVDVVQTTIELTSDWSIALGTPFRRRHEDGQLVLWRPALTLWIAIEPHESQSSKLDELQAQLPAQATEISVEELSGLSRLSFRLEEPRSDAKRPVLHAITLCTTSSLHLRAYFDHESELVAARALVTSIRGRSDLRLH